MISAGRKSLVPPLRRGAFCVIFFSFTQFCQGSDQLLGTHEPPSSQMFISPDVDRMKRQILPALQINRGSGAFIYKIILASSDADDKSSITFYVFFIEDFHDRSISPMAAAPAFLRMPGARHPVRAVHLTYRIVPFEKQKKRLPVASFLAS